MNRSSLDRLAVSFGVETSYVDMAGRTKIASEESLLAVLRALGAGLASLRDVPEALSRRQRFLKSRRAQPVRVAWNGCLPGRRRRLPAGYHRLHGGLVISAPRRSFRRPNRDWGLFLPLHALHSARNPGAGDLTDLAVFARWAGRQGASFVGTLPLLDLFLDRPPYDPSPYAPVSRLFWNPFWLDLGRGTDAGGGEWVDYRRQMEAKRKLLEKRAACWTPPRRWLRERPEARAYARFRGSRAFLYAAWLEERQMERLGRAARRTGSALYFDLPVGVHPDGYDAREEKALFVEGMSVGAPPDPLFRGGQDWGFRPPHPERIREEGYGYFIRSLRHSMRVASMLRVDHVMGLHRLFWVPRGLPAAEGVYVRYRHEELYAILCAESHRSRCEIIGEDLGTVPPEVRRSLRRHRMAGMFVVQYEAQSGDGRLFRPPPPGCMASLNTHDMPPFAAFWRRWKGRRSWVERLRREGWLKAGEGVAAPAVARALLRMLAAGRARVLLINLEDLWGERRSQNVPGTRGGRNWRRKARFPLERFSRMRKITRFLGEIGRFRPRRRPTAC